MLAEGLHGLLKGITIWKKCLHCWWLLLVKSFVFENFCNCSWIMWFVAIIILGWFCKITP